MAQTLFADETLFSFRAGCSLNVALNVGVLTNANVATAVTGAGTAAMAAALAALALAKTNVETFPENEVLKARLARDCTIPFALGEVTAARATIALLRGETAAGTSTAVGVI